MDIHRWLQDTTDRAPPGESREDPPLAFQDPPSVAGSKKYRRKRRRKDSDSSIIAPQILTHQSTDLRRKATHAELPGKSRRAGRDVSRSGSESWHGSSRESTRDFQSVVSAGLLPAKTYERRARHKTKADRYDPKTRRAKKTKQKEEYRGRAAKHVRRKSHQSGDGGRVAGLVQSFQLKNGPKNHRLTLNQDVNMGLFRHGRASTQLAGKSNGLPDLVFNEMKFLHRPKEHQDEAAHENATHESTKMEMKRRAENDEISTYFERSRGMPDRPVTASDNRTKAPPDKQVELRTARREPSPGRDSNSRLSPENLPKIAFLGFGSRGQVHVNSQVNRTTTPFTWSESVPRQVSVQVKNTRAQDPHVSIDIANSQAHEQVLDRNKSRHADIRSYRDTIRHGQCIPSKRTRPSAVVEVLQPADLATTDKMRRTTSYTSLSLPRVSRSDIDQARLRKEEADSTFVTSDKSFETTDILKVRKRMHALIDQPSPMSIDMRSAVQNKENILAYSPSSTAELVRTAQRAFLPTKAQSRRYIFDDVQQGRVRTTSRPQSRRDLKSLEVRQDRADVITTRQHEKHPEPRVYQDVLRPVHEGSCKPTLPPELIVPLPSRPVRSHIWTESTPQCASPDQDDGDDEMLLVNHVPAFHKHDLVQLPNDEHIPYDVLQQGPDFRMVSEEVVYNNARPTPTDKRFQWPHVSSMPASIAPDPGVGVAHICARDFFHADETDAEDAMQEFWRPNRLY